MPPKEVGENETLKTCRRRMTKKCMKIQIHGEGKSLKLSGRYNGELLYEIVVLV